MRAMWGARGGEGGCVGGRGGSLNRLYSHTLTQMYYSLFGGNSALILLTLAEEFHSPSPTVFLTSSSPYCFQLSLHFLSNTSSFLGISALTALLLLTRFNSLSLSPLMFSPLPPLILPQLLCHAERLRCHSE